LPPIKISELGRQQIIDALSPFGISLTDDQQRQVREYLSLLLKWNRAVNLTATTDPIEVLQRHFGESMFISKLLAVENCRLADVGSGAGFPGLALKIACPTASVTLIESNKKKCAFLSEVIRALGLTAVEVCPVRFEQLHPENLQSDLITARALGNFGKLLRWSKQALSQRGHVILWLGAEDSTRISRDKEWVWQPPVLIPESKRRFILIGRMVQRASEAAGT